MEPAAEQPGDDQVIDRLRRHRAAAMEPAAEQPGDGFRKIPDWPPTKGPQWSRLLNSRVTHYTLTAFDASQMPQWSRLLNSRVTGQRSARAALRELAAMEPAAEQPGDHP